MKTSLRALSVIGTLTLFGLSTPASAVVNWYNSAAGTDNSGGAAVDNIVDQSGSWVDTFISEIEPNTQKGTVPVSQVNGNASNFGLTSADAHMMVYSFGDLGIANAEDVTFASLHLSYDFSNTSQTFTVWGLTGTVDNTLTWNNIQANTGFDPTNPSGTSYGSFTGTNGAALASSTSIDLTDAIAAYVGGDITGIIIGTSAITPGSFSGTDDRILFNTSDNTNPNLRPSLMVDFVPEPSTYALIFGLVALVGVVRRSSPIRGRSSRPACTAS